MGALATERIYLDYNASAPLLTEARDAMLAALEIDANPSSVHANGRAARRVVEDGRRAVAALVKARPEHVVFTSGATEAASTLLQPDWALGRGAVRMSHLFVMASDHPCLRSGGHFDPAHVSLVGVDGDGICDIAALRHMLEDHDTETGLPLVAVHSVNNETGVIQPIAEISALVAEAGGILVVDSVQAAGRIPMDMEAGYADFLILSAHKIGGPRGAGALVARSDLMMPRPLVRGGGQEKGHRAGTENVAGVAGFGAAARKAMDTLEGIEQIAALRDRIEAGIRTIAPDAVFHGDKVSRVANTSYFSLPDFKAETAQIAFDLAGVSLSSGAACSSGKVGVSHVLEAMGADAALGALRVSVGPETSVDEVDRFLAIAKEIIARRTVKNAAA